LHFESVDDENKGQVKYRASEYVAGIFLMFENGVFDGKKRIKRDRLST